MLEKIKSPDDVKNLSYQELNTLSDEIRETLIKTVSKNGGHLGSNLGTVELTLALHRVFNSPLDSIIFDVGHQCYTHKLLTGRYESFDTLRKEDGISGFPNRFESEHDIIGTGHSGTSVSAALGIAQANKIDGNDNFSVAVVGDGSLTNGMIYEAMDNCTGKNLKLCIVINDNEMSISKNVGAISNYLSEVTSSKSYINFKNKVYSLFMKQGKTGEFLYVIFKKIKDFFKRIMISKNLFECLGFRYYGPIDGHDQKLLESVFIQAKRKDTPTLVHVITKKGKGYEKAETNPENYHSVSEFNPDTGIEKKNSNDFSSAFGEIITNAAEKNSKICAVTAAMEQGTGLSGFAEKFPERYFDVGIAEEHAITFCAGLALKGKIPVFAVYSSFLQRGYDQLIHDISIQKLPCIFAVDRAGTVPGDGITHQGIFDVAFIKTVPGFEIFSPATYKETEKCFNLCISNKNASVIRYPKGGEINIDNTSFQDFGDFSVASYGEGDTEITLVTYGIITQEAIKCAENLSKEYKVNVIKLLKIHPFDFGLLEQYIDSSSVICFIEEGIKFGGIGETLGSYLAKNSYHGKYSHIGADTNQSFKGKRKAILDSCGLTEERITESIKALLK